MPRKIQRSGSITAAPQMVITDSGAAILALGHAAAEISKAQAQIYTASAMLLATTVQSLAECSKGYFNYLEACQRTRQVEIWSYTVIAEAREHTRQIEIQAEIVLRQLEDVQSSREARMEVVRTFLGEHHRLHELFIHQSGSEIQNLTIEERVHLTQSRDLVLQRLRDLESALASLANAL